MEKTNRVETGDEIVEIRGDEDRSKNRGETRDRRDKRGDDRGRKTGKTRDTRGKKGETTDKENKETDERQSREKSGEQQDTGGYRRR